MECRTTTFVRRCGHHRTATETAMGMASATAVTSARFLLGRALLAPQTQIVSRAFAGRMDLFRRNGLRRGWAPRCVRSDDDNDAIVTHAVRFERRCCGAERFTGRRRATRRKSGVDDVAGVREGGRTFDVCASWRR